MPDIFGYAKPTTSHGQLASADFALVTVGKANSIVQDVQVQYAQKVEEVSQVGDSQIYWIPGKPQGNVSVSKLVGSGKFFADWELGQCGVIASASVSLSGGGGGNKGCSFQGKGTLSFAGGVVENFSVKLGAQQQTIAETISFKIASLSSN